MVTYPCFVEKKRDAIEILEKNIEKLKVKNKIKIFSNDIFELIEKHDFFKSKFDIIFCDPPFKDKNIAKLVQLIFSKSLLNKNGIISKNPTMSVKNPGMIKSNAAIAIDAPVIISYMGNLF